MVIFRRIAIFVAAWMAVMLPGALAWADPAAPLPLIKRLDGPRRAKVLAALAGLIILGFAMVGLIWLGARFTQRYRSRKPYFQPTTRPGEHEWAKRPLDRNSSEEDGRN